MNGKRIRMGLIAAAAMIMLLAAAGAEATVKETVKGGKVVRREWVDENGSLTAGPEGYAYVTRSISGTTVTERFFDAEGNPFAAAGGYCGQMLTYGNRHRLEEIVYVDADGKKTASVEGYARLKIAYNPAGGVTAASYFDVRNELVVVPSLGYAALKTEYRGKTPVRTTYLDADKQPVDMALGYAVRIQKVNKSSKVIGISFEHADGTAADCPEGWARCERELDKKGREVSARYYDLSGNLIRMGEGFAYEVRSWDGDRVCTVSRYDETEQQVTMEGGVAQIRQEFNADGQLIRETCVNNAGGAVTDETGVTVRSYTWDEHGHMTRISFSDAQGHAVLNTDGYAGYDETLDAEGFPERRIYFGTDGKPVNTQGGASEIRFLYDANRQMTGKEYYDTNGVLVRAE